MDYTISKCKRGILSPEEVHFFYYDIMRNQGDSIQCVYEWNKDVQDYLDSKSYVSYSLNKVKSSEKKTMFYRKQTTAERTSCRAVGRKRFV